MCVTKRRVVECEKVAKVTEAEMSFHIILLINDTAAKCLLVSLSL